MSFYDLLGVPRDANLRAIKAAYRRRAKELHPDTPGGDKHRFVELGRAYRVLTDVDLRARYDATGSVDEADFNVAENIFRQALVDGLGQIIAQAGDQVEEVDIIGALRDNVDRQWKVAGQQIEAAKARKAKLERLKERITRTGEGRNLFVDVLITQVQQIEGSIRAGERAFRILGLCRDELANYESIVEMVQTVSYWFGTGSGTSNTSGGQVFVWGTQ